MGKGVRLFRKIVSAMMMSLLVLATLALILNVQQVKASGTIYIRADGSIDPPTAPIYTANNITYTLTGNITATDGIVIERDNIVLNGAGYTVQGTGSGTGITLSGRSNVTVENMTIKNFAWAGICLESSSGNTLSGNNVANNLFGIFLDSGSNVLSGNNVANNTYGIELDDSSGNTLHGNVMVGNRFNFGVYGYALSSYLQSVDTSNLVDGKPIYYFVNQSDVVVNADVYPEVGYLGFVNCANVTVQGLNLKGNEEGLLLAFTNDSKITGNSVTANLFEGIYLYSSSSNTLSGNNVTTNNGTGIGLLFSSSNALSGNNVANNGEVGIYLGSSSGNTFSGNNVTANNGVGIGLIYSSDSNVLSGNKITNNGDGIWLNESSSNTLSGNNVANNVEGISLIFSPDNSIFHNDFVGNSRQVPYSLESNCTWDDGYPSGGNFWSDYNGTDLYGGPFQNISGSDGIGDTPYVVDAQNQDRYPLMNPWSSPEHDVAIINVSPLKTVVGLGYSVNVSVTVIDRGKHAEAFNVTGYANTTIVASQNVTLSAGDSATVTFTWNTTSFALGNYTVDGYAWPVPGETNTANNNCTGGWVIVSLVGDITGPNSWPDGKCDIRDLSYVAKRFGTTPSSPMWDPNADVTGPTPGVPDGKIDIRDISLVAKHFGEHL